jgi:hypothetical protein
MAKINVHTRPGALKELLDTKKMSQMDAHTHVNYRSSRVVLLSVEPGGTQSRRAPVFQGSLPPTFAFPNPPGNRSTISVNGVELPTLDDDAADDVPF